MGFATYEDASAAVATPVAGAVFGGFRGAQVEITGLFSRERRQGGRTRRVPGRGAADGRWLVSPGIGDDRLMPTGRSLPDGSSPHGAELREPFFRRLALAFTGRRAPRGLG